MIQIDKDVSLYQVSEDELKSFALDRGFPAYRAIQIRNWLSKGVTTADEMINLPKALRKELDAAFTDNQIELLDKIASEVDETVKYVFRLTDGNVVEAVFMVYQYGTSVCVSSQAGCRMGCHFCASADAGFGRNLTAGEMLAQIHHIHREQGVRIDSVVVMGIGEPLENLEEVILLIDWMNQPDGLNIGRRHVTVSTCGIVPQMLKFADKLSQVTLAVSLHAANDTLRREIMPINKAYPLAQLMDACRYYLRKSSRRLTFEYILLAGVNDRVEQAHELADLLKGLNCHVNLIPANEFPGGMYKRSSVRDQLAFRAALDERNIAVTIRRELGKDILAACGQLRRRLENE